MKTMNLNNIKQNNAKHSNKAFVRGKNSTAQRLLHSSPDNEIEISVQQEDQNPSMTL